MMNSFDSHRWVIGSGWVRRRAAHVFAAFVVMSSASLMAQTNPIVLSGNKTFADLPSGIEKRITPNMTRDEVAAILSQQPSIVLDGATLSIDAPRTSSGRSIAVKELVLRNGAKIITNGVNFEIVALTIVSDGGEILSFDGASGRVAGDAAVGASGISGLNAGTLVLNGSIRPNNVLRVNLRGQGGQDGGRGNTGTQGAQGPRGENGADHLLDCARGGGNGGTGSKGGKGGRGGDGGAGGNGGTLILRGNVAAQRQLIDFEALGGAGGAAGAPGAGGEGGPGGLGGSGTTYCRGGSPGSKGAQGDLGEPGERGPSGRNGSISAD